MGARMGRRWWAVGALAGGVFTALLVLGTGPTVRHLVRSAAARHGLLVDVASVWPAWGGARLVGTVCRPQGVDGVELRVDEIRLSFGPTLHLEKVDLRGAELRATGSRARLEEELDSWRGAPAASGQKAGRAVVVAFEGASARWLDGDSADPRLEVRGLSGERGPDGLKMSVELARARLGGASVALSHASAEIDDGGSLKRARASSLLVDWDGRRGPRAEKEAHDDLEKSPPSSASRATAAELRPKVDVATPLLEIPDLRAARTVAEKATVALARRVAPGVGLQIDAVVWKITPRESSPLTVGPGPLTLSRGNLGIEVGFAAGATTGGTPLTVRAHLPLERGDTTLEVQGGPVSLALLGLQDGPSGLFDVAHATVSGNARFSLAADAAGLDFDCTWSARGLSLRDSRLASDAIRGLDAQLRARGSLSMPGDLRFDELTATVGALEVQTSGLLDQEQDHVAAAFRFRVPTAPCQTLLNSAPTALLPVVQGMTFSGTFGAEGRVVFDSRSLDDLELEYDVRDRCRVDGVPPSLAREAFTRPFVHRVYLPDGSVHEEETGPTTPAWTPLDQVSPFMEVALTTTEDGAFRRHHGFNQGAIRSSIVANLKARRFVRGASTITMQLAKNLFLSREKTLSRKLEEVILTDYLEQAFSKDEVLELYLNVVEFGPAVYGIGAAAEYYFGRPPAELDIAESFFLASLLPAPLHYAAMRDAGDVPEARMQILRSLIRTARSRGLISDEELLEGLRQPIVFWRGGERPPARPAVPSRARIDALSPGRATEPEPDDADYSPP